MQAMEAQRQRANSMARDRSIDEERGMTHGVQSDRPRRDWRLNHSLPRWAWPAFALLIAVAALSMARWPWAAPVAGFIALAGLRLPASLNAVLAAPASTPSSPPALTSSGAEGPIGKPAELWQTIVDAMPDAILVLDRLGAVIHYNSRAKELFPRVRTGAPLPNVSRNPELIEAVDRAVDHPDPIEVNLVEHVPVERRISARVCGLAGNSGTGNEPAMLISFRDLSEQDRLAQMRADFVANASHELRTPLASLRGYVETLQGAARNDPVAREKFLASMATQAARMTRLIDDLLSLSRIEMKQHLAPRDLIELNEVTGHVTQMLEPVAQSAKVALTLERLEGSAVVRGDRDEIVQVLQNLIHNAIKYGREGGKVQIRLAREPSERQGRHRLAVSVTDDGPGIAAEHLPRLTERFYRVNPASSRDKGGTGLGLAIVKHVMNRHRGDLRIASQAGHGSTFTVIFDEATAP